MAVYVDGGVYTSRSRLEKLMLYRNLGRTGIKVSPYALGALMFATQVGNADPDDSIQIIHKALDAGINLVDAVLEPRGGALGGGTARPGAVPYRAAAVLDPEPRHRA